MVAYHFCQVDNSPTCSVPEFVHSLAAQLSQAPSLRPYYNQLMTNYELRTRLTQGYCLARPDQALEEGVLEPLRSVQGVDGVGASPCLVLIDGLCDSEPHRPDRGDSIGSFLARHLDSFPSWIKFLVTVRSDQRGQAAVKGLPFHQMSLDKSKVDERVRKDMTDFIGLHLSQSQSLVANVTPTAVAPRKSSGPNSASNTSSSHGSSTPDTASPPPERFLQHLTDLADGNFLYARLTLELVERGHLVIKSGSFKVLPVSVSEVFLLELNLRFNSLSAFDRVSDILSVCLAALEPMTVAEVYQSVLALQAGNQGRQRLAWPEFVGRFNQLSGLLVRRADDTVMFHHPLFREWLLRRAEAADSGKFLCDPARGHLGIAIRMARETSGAGGDPVQVGGAEKTLDVAFHTLKSNVYRDCDPSVLAGEEFTPGDLQSSWLAQACGGDLSEALACPKNVFQVRGRTSEKLHNGLIIFFTFSILQPRVNVSRLLLLAGASPLRPSDCLRGAPLLSLFAERGNEEMAALLLEFRADPSQPNSDGVSPLMFAAGAGRVETARLLVASGAAVAQVDREDRCALVHAAMGGHLEAVELLVSCDWPSSAGAIVNGEGDGKKKGKSSRDLDLGEAVQQALVAAAAAGRFQVSQGP